MRFHFCSGLSKRGTHGAHSFFMWNSSSKIKCTRSIEVPTAYANSRIFRNKLWLYFRRKLTLHFGRKKFRCCSSEITKWNEIFLDCTRLLDRAKVFKYFIDVFKIWSSFYEEFLKELEIFLDSQALCQSRKMSSTFWNFSSTSVTFSSPSFVSLGGPAFRFRCLIVPLFGYSEDLFDLCLEFVLVLRAEKTRTFLAGNKKNIYKSYSIRNV